MNGNGSGHILVMVIRIAHTQTGKQANQIILVIKKIVLQWTKTVSGMIKAVTKLEMPSFVDSVGVLFLTEFFKFDFHTKYFVHGQHV